MRGITVLGLLLAGAGSAAAQGTIQYEHYELANGLSVLLVPDRTIPVVTVNVWYNVGSRDERPGRSGFAHLFEHMMFKSTRHMANETFDRLTEDVGGNNNAFTADELAQDRTVILSTHIVEDVAVLCPRFAVIRQGKVVALTTPHDARASLAGAVFEGAVEGEAFDEIRRTHRVTQAVLFEGRNRVRIHAPDGNAPALANTFRNAINPPFRPQINPVFPDLYVEAASMPVTLPNGNLVDVPRPLPQAMSVADPGMQVVNYRNEPVGLRVFDPNKLGPDGNPGSQADGLAGVHTGVAILVVRMVCFWVRPISGSTVSLFRTD